MKIQSIWRYPVKSMGGEALPTTGLSHDGVIGDRCYAIHDGTTIRGAKKFAALMDFSASYVEEPDGIEVPEVHISRAGTKKHSGAADVNEFLSTQLGQKVTLDQLRSAEDLAYYESPAEKPDMSELQKMLGLEDGEPMPDFSAFPPELFSYATPPGTFFDAFPILVLTTSSLAALQQACPDSLIDERRFRPNIVLDTNDMGAGFLEEDWQASYLCIGDAVIQLTLACPRCVMTTIAFDDLPKDPLIMRQLVKLNHHKLGIYGRVFKPGHINIGDTATVTKDQPG